MCTQHNAPLAAFSRGFAASCVLGIVLLVGIRCAAGPLIPHNQQNKQQKNNASPLKKAEQLRAEALRLVKKATLQDLTTAVMQLQQSASLFRAAGITSAAADDYRSIGKIYFIWSRYKAALRVYRLALTLTNKDDYNLRCSLLSLIAITYVTVGDLKHSAQYANQARGMADRSTNPEAKAEAGEALGMLLLYSKPLQALELFRGAAETFKNSGNVDEEAAALRYVGLSLSTIGSIRDALDAQNEALRLWRSTDNIYGIAEAQGALGLLWNFAGEPEKALDAYGQARHIFSRGGDRDNEAIILNGLGFVSLAIGNYESALQNFTQAERIFTSLGDEFGAIGAIDGAARALWSLRRYPQAKALYAMKLRRARQAGNYRVQATALLNLGDIYLTQKDYKHSRLFYLHALTLCRSVDHTVGETDALIHLGRLNLQVRQHKAAIQSFQHALELANATDQVPRQAEAHYGLANVYEVLKQHDQAKAESESAIQIIESERTKVSDFDSRATYFASVHQYYQLYIEILMQLDQEHPDEGFVQLAFEAAEKSKVRSLLDMLASSSPETQCPTAALEVKNNSTPATGDCSTPAASALTLVQVQKEIQGDDVVLLEYALSPERSYLWLVEDSRISAILLPGEDRISQLAMKYHAALIARQPLPAENAAHYAERVAHADQELDRLSPELSKMLLGPVAGSLTGKRVLVVPDGVLRYIPFAALQLPLKASDEPNQRLGEKFEVVTLPSASTIESLRAAFARRSAPNRLAAVFADPVFAADDPRIRKQGRAKAPSVQIPTLSAALRDVPVNASKIPRLVASGAEADAIAQALSGQVDVATGFGVNREAVLSGHLSQYRYIHFATHGLLDSRHPEFSGLVLSLVDQNGKPQDGYLRIRDIYGLRLSADLVVLSSCSSALGKDLESEGIIGLTRAFLFAGSNRVISSLWKVDDEATEELMKAFYSQLHAGASPAAALRTAQSTLANDPHWKSPYYWAAFILQGEYK